MTGPDTISVAGQLDVICFDKTGTLTEQGLELGAIVPCTSGTFAQPTSDMQQLPPLVPQLLARWAQAPEAVGALVGAC